MLIYDIQSYTAFNCRAGDIERGVVRLILTRKGVEEMDAFFPIDAISYVSHYDNTVVIMLKSQKKAFFNHYPDELAIVKDLLFELRKAVALESKVAITIHAERITDEN